MSACLRWLSAQAEAASGAPQCWQYEERYSVESGDHSLKSLLLHIFFLESFQEANVRHKMSYSRE